MTRRFFKYTCLVTKFDIERCTWLWLNSGCVGILDLSRPELIFIIRGQLSARMLNKLELKLIGRTQRCIRKFELKMFFSSLLSNEAAARTELTEVLLMQSSGIAASSCSVPQLSSQPDTHCSSMIWCDSQLLWGVKKLLALLFFTVDFYSSAPVIINQTHETSPLVKKKIWNWK